MFNRAFLEIRLEGICSELERKAWSMGEKECKIVLANP
jgi:hypothetical protein